MPNAWVEFVRQYAKENNLSYGCAISEAGPEYRKMKGMNTKPKEKTKSKINVQKQEKEEKPKEVEPPKRARRKYFEGLSEPEKEDRKMYKD